MKRAFESYFRWGVDANVGEMVFNDRNSFGMSPYPIHKVGKVLPLIDVITNKMPRPVKRTSNRLIEIAQAVRVDPAATGRRPKQQVKKSEQAALRREFPVKPRQFT